MVDDGYEKGRSYYETVIERLHEVKQSQWRTFQGIVYVQLGIVVLIGIVSVWSFLSSDPTIIIGGPNQRVVDLRILKLAGHDSTQPVDLGAVRLKPPPSIMSASGDTEGADTLRVHEGFFAFGDVKIAIKLPQPVAIPTQLLDDELDILEGDSSSIPSFSLTPGDDTGIFISAKDLVVDIVIDESKPEPVVFEPTPPVAPADTIPKSEYPGFALESGQWGVAQVQFEIGVDGRAKKFKAEFPHPKKRGKTIRKTVKYRVVEERTESWFFAAKAGDYIFNNWEFEPARDSLRNLVEGTITVTVYFRYPNTDPPDWWDLFHSQDSIESRL